MDYIRETPLLRMSPLGIYTPAPIQIALATRNFFQSLATTILLPTTNKKFRIFGLRYSGVRLHSYTAQAVKYCMQRLTSGRFIARGKGPLPEQVNIYSSLVIVCYFGRSGLSTG